MTAKIKLAVGLIAAASPLLSAAAAAQNVPSSDFDRGYQAGRADSARANQAGNFDAPPPPREGGQSGYYEDPHAGDDVPPPPGYDGNQPPPPPPGYQPDPRYSANDPRDQRYAQSAEEWARRACVPARNGNTAGGAVIGGLFGALLGSSVAGRHDRGAGALMGGIAGAAVGGAAGSAADNATSPGCPPGTVVRAGAPHYVYDDFGPDYGYAAPGWYRPWVFIDNRWSYRPYPYHVWYYGHYGRGRGWGGYRGGYGRGWNGQRH